MRVLYVSPLKALVYDVERNLRVPLAGIATARRGARRDAAVPRVERAHRRHPPKERREQARDPGEILVTTPESLYLLLGSRAREHLRSVETVIVDEVHALAGDKARRASGAVARTALGAVPDASRSASACPRPRGRSPRSRASSAAIGR